MVTEWIGRPAALGLTGALTLALGGSTPSGGAITHTDYGDVEVIVDRGEELGTTYEVRIVVPRLADGDAAIDADAVVGDARDLVRALESRFSEWIPDSEISFINANAGRRPVPVSSDVRTLLEGSRRVSELTEGAFDVTWKPLDAVWSAARAVGRAASTAEVASVLGAVDYRNVVIADGIAFRDPRTEIGVAGVAKGWIIDAVFAELVAHGLTDVIVNIGGDLRTIGGETDGRRTLLVTDPYAPSRTVAVLTVGESAVATSGNYLRASPAGATPIGHILDPRTGFPPEFDGSVTVLTRDAAMADALATGFFVMGRDATLELARALVGVDVVVVDRTGVHATLDADDGTASLSPVLDSDP